MTSGQRKSIWGWMMFDWASQPYYTLIVTFIFGPYFAEIATTTFAAQGLSEQAADARAQTMWSWGQTGAGLLIAALAPILGAVADQSGRRMPWVIFFSLFYIAGGLGLWWMVPDGSFLTGALIAFAIGLIGAEFTTIFTNSILPDLGTDEEVGRISGSGFAVGYAGGVSALFIMLLLFAENADGVTLLGNPPVLGLDPDAREGTRFVGPFVALWYALFMVLFFVWVREVRRPKPEKGIRAAMSSLRQTLIRVPRQRSLAAFLGGSMLYRDGLNALYGFGGTYAILVLNWSVVQVGVFGIVAAISAAIVSWLGGKADAALGPKPVIRVSIWILLAVCVVIAGMDRTTFFGVPLSEGSTLPDVILYVCGALIGGLGGTLQSASRSMMVRHCTTDRPTEGFGLYALSGKATAFFGPALIGAATYVTGNARLGVIPVIGLFVLGLVLLLWVNPKGERDPADV